MVLSMRYGLMSHRRRRAHRDIELSARELEVLELAATGRFYKQIAAVLRIRPRTVTNHLNACHRKLNAPNTTAAVVRALQLGLIYIGGIGVIVREV